MPQKKKKNKSPMTSPKSKNNDNHVFPSPSFARWNEERKESLQQFSTTTIDSQFEDLSKVLVAMSEKHKTIEEKRMFDVEMEEFKKLFARYKVSKGKTIQWDKIQTPQDDLVVPYDNLGKCEASRVSELTKKLAVIKLNGGLGTSMGCTGPKSVISVHSDLTFLDLTVHQIEDLNQRYEADVPLILMNSFNTHEETLKVTKKYSNIKARILHFNQSKFPRIKKDSMLPMTEDPYAAKDNWYPPGHGDVYRSLVNSGILERLLKEGREYVFISNIDNLGATVDFNILKYLVDNNIDFLMEVTDKTRSDIKGGTLIDYEGKAKLLEIAQCPPDKVDEFKSIKKFKIFNTNNLWISLKAIQKLVQEDKMTDIDVIPNAKEALGQEVLQLETAAGAAMQFFDHAKGVNVPRSRFLPVKQTGDLLLIQSNLYELQNGYLLMNPKRPYPSVPLINLGEHFKKVSEYLGHFKGPPNILELDQLTISGNGTVIIVANQGSRIDIPDGSVLENKVISGNLRILDH